MKTFLTRHVVVRWDEPMKTRIPQRCRAASISARIIETASSFLAPLSIFVAALGLLALSDPVAEADTVVANEDVVLRQGQPNTAFQPGAPEAYMAAGIESGGVTGLYYGFMRFDLSAIVGFAAGDGTLTLTYRNPASFGWNDGHTLEIRDVAPANAGWSATSATWNTLDGATPWVGADGGLDGSTSVALYAGGVAPSPGNTVSFTIPQANIDAWLGSGSANLLLRSPSATSGEAVGMFAGHGEANSPTLEFDTIPIPEPSTLTLAALGLLGLLGFTRRRRK